MEPVYEGEEVIVSLYDRILGRVALDNVVDVITDQAMMEKTKRQAMTALPSGVACFQT